MTDVQWPSITSPRFHGFSLFLIFSFRPRYRWTRQLTIYFCEIGRLHLMARY